MLEVILTLLAFLIPAAKKLLDSHLRKQHEKIIETNAELYRILREFRVNLDAQRVVTIKSENGGGVPDIGATCWVSVLHESVQDDFPSVIDYRTRMDMEYSELLRSLWKNGHEWVVAHTLPEDSTLRGKYEADGIYASFVFAIATDPKRATYYGSANFSEEGYLALMGNPVSRTKKMDYVLDIRNLYEKAGYVRSF